MSIRIAHLSDLHVLDLTGTSPLRFLNKRATGLINLLGSRRGAHPLHIADALPKALGAAGVDVDHVLITGDLSNLALPSEFQRAKQVVAAVGGPERVTVIPGNHDVYTAGAAHTGRFESFFGPWMVELSADEATIAAACTAGRAHYPFAKTIAPGVRVYGLSSAIVAPPLVAWGKVGPAQLRRLRQLIAEETGVLDGSGADGGQVPIHTRIVLVHHNVHPRAGLKRRASRLIDSNAVMQTLQDINATVLLHGHTHTPEQHRLRAKAQSGADGSPPSGTWVLGCGSSTWLRPTHNHLARFNVLTFTAAGQLSSVEPYIWSPETAQFSASNEDLLNQAMSRPLQPSAR